MASRKNQHYVPQCMLRPFGFGDDRSCVRAYLSNHNRFIPTASVSGQCSKSYYYGQDGRLEDALGNLEGEYSSVLRRLTNNGTPSENDLNFLRDFMLVQHHRTPSEIDPIRERMQTMRDDAIEISKRNQWPPPEGAADPVTHQMAVDMSLDCAHNHIMTGYVDDLSMAIVVNHTKTRFVTSDNPSVMTNRWLIQKGHSCLGLRDAGTILMMPLSPRHLMLAFDSAVYKIRIRNSFIPINRDDDIIAMNYHQFLQNKDTIYLSNDVPDATITNMHKRCNPFRPESWHRTTYLRQSGVSTDVSERYDVCSRDEAIEAMTSETDRREMLTHIEGIYPRPPAWPRLFSLKMKPLGFQLGRRPVREIHRFSRE